jgi:hypothetical protein
VRKLLPKIASACQRRGVVPYRQNSGKTRQLRRRSAISSALCAGCETA